VKELKSFLYYKKTQNIIIPEMMDVGPSGFEPETHGPEPWSLPS
jgi:hypothetical protein